jgi:hypothetical protein
LRKKAPDAGGVYMPDLAGLDPKTTYNVGVVHGSTTVNTIALWASRGSPRLPAPT